MITLAVQKNCVQWWKCFISVFSTISLSTWKVAKATEKGNFTFYLVLTHLNSHMGLVATIQKGICWESIPKWTNTCHHVLLQSKESIWMSCESINTRAQRSILRNNLKKISLCSRFYWWGFSVFYTSPSLWQSTSDVSSWARCQEKVCFTWATSLFKLTNTRMISILCVPFVTTRHRFQK